MTTADDTRAAVARFAEAITNHDLDALAMAMTETATKTAHEDVRRWCGGLHHRRIPGRPTASLHTRRSCSHRAIGPPSELESLVARGRGGMSWAVELAVACANSAQFVRRLDAGARKRRYSPAGLHVAKTPPR